MKASKVVAALCDAWQKDLPPKIKAAEEELQICQESKDSDPQAYHAAHAALTRAKGAAGRVAALRTNLVSLVREFGDVEVPVK